MRARWREGGEGGGEGGMDGGTLREWKRDREKEDAGTKRGAGFFFFFLDKEKKSHRSAVCRGFVWIKSVVTVLHVMCTNNDGMENHNRNWGVVFKVAEKMRDAGVRPPPHPPRQPPCTL